MGLAAPYRAFAQPSARARRLEIIMATGRTKEYAAAVDGLVAVLGAEGWKRGDNLVIEEQWSAGGKAKAQVAVQQVLTRAPDVVLGQSLEVIQALQAATKTVPIVFVHVADPVAGGLVSNLARPDGNITGVTNTEPSIGGKWLQLLKEMAPQATRVAMLVHLDTQPDGGEMFLRPFVTAARTLGVAPVPGTVRGLADIEALIADLGAKRDGGFVVMPDAFFAGLSTKIVSLAQKFGVPAAYPYRYYVEQGGLLSYGVNNVDLFRQAATYIDRILRGAKPADLAVQQASRFELVINEKTAKALDITIPQSILLRADGVIG